MKNAKLFLSALIGSALLFSCSDDDDKGGSSTGGEIKARWNPVRTEVKVGTANPVAVDYADNEPGCNKDYIEFADANVLNRAVYNRNVDTNECEAVAGTPGTWAKDDNDLTISGGSAAYQGTYEITRLTGSELRIKSENVSGGVTTATTIFFTKATNQQ